MKGASIVDALLLLCRKNFKIQLQINTKCDSIEQDEKREKEGEKSARNRAKT